MGGRCKTGYQGQPGYFWGHLCLARVTSKRVSVLSGPRTKALVIEWDRLLLQFHLSHVPLWVLLRASLAGPEASHGGGHQVLVRRMWLTIMTLDKACLGSLLAVGHRI